MVKPIDFDEFFKEQQERMEISEEDWDQYEERVHQDRKRKRTERENSKTKLLMDDLEKHVEGEAIESSMHPHKKRKVFETAAAKSHPSLADPVIHPSPPPRVVAPSPASDPHPPQQEVMVSSSLRRVARSSTKLRKLMPFPVHIPPASTSSNVTTPTATPLTHAATTGSLSHTTSSADDSDGVPKPKTKRKSAPRSKSMSESIDKSTSRRTSGEQKDRVQAERLATKAALQAKRDAEKAKKAQNDKEARMTPLEYAAILQEKWQTRVSNTPIDKLFLKDKVIFLVFEEQSKSTKDTRIKLDIIARNGGQVATEYDPEVVTHIISGGSTITLKKTLRALGLKSLSDIPPNIHTVNWDWIISGLSNVTPDSEVMHELYKQRLAHKYTNRPGRDDPKGKGKQKSGSITYEHSVIEDFTSAHDSQNDDDAFLPTRSEHTANSAPQATSASTSNIRHSDEQEDPLLPFYAKAREEAETADSEDEPHIPIPTIFEDHKVSKLKGFQCDKKGVHLRGVSPNWDLIEKLAELREMHRDMGTDGDKWRVIGYQKAIGSLKSHPTRIKSREEAMKLSGVSDKTADKIMEIIGTGELQRIKYTKTKDLTAMRVFSGIYGVGPSTARKWFHQGLKSLDDVRRAVDDGTHKLSIVQEIGLKFYDDINDRMPRSEAEEIFWKIKPIALGLDAKVSLEIMGSFRRGKENCGDIDILLTRPTGDGETHSGILPRLCNLLHKQGILTEDLAVPEDWESLEATYRGLCRRDERSRRRRIDILCIPYESRGAARIYYTGDDIFNRSIRLKANKMNMSLNQRGLFQGVVRDPQDRTKKLCTGSLLCSDSEKKIFEILGVPWQEPHERVRGE